MLACTLRFSAGMELANRLSPLARRIFGGPRMHPSPLCCSLHLGAALLLLATGCQQPANSVELLNASYDPTRELYRDLNAAFAAHYEQETGQRVTIRQSHGGSASQARTVVDGLQADIVTLAVPADIDAIRKFGVITADWEQRLPNAALPYCSTIVFVVRRGNPRGIKDWPDLFQDGVQVITPNPKTSGNGKLSYLALWGWAIRGGKSEAEAEALIRKFYAQVPVLDTAARAATVTFAQRGIGDVHLTWENEAHIELQEAGGALEIVYPPTSILAEPKVAVVDRTVDRKGTRAAAEAFLQYLYTDAAQETIARHFYRPSNAAILRRHEAVLRPIELFKVTTIARDWDDAFQRHFAEGAIFDRCYLPKQR